MNPRFERLDYETSSFALNSGTLLILLQINLILLLSIALLALCKCKLAVKLNSWLQNKLLWNSFIDLLSGA